MSLNKIWQYKNLAIASHTPLSNLKKKQSWECKHFIIVTANLSFPVWPCKDSDPSVFLPLLHGWWACYYKRFIWEHANWMFFRMGKICLPTLPHLSLSQSIVNLPNFVISLMVPLLYFNILSPLPCNLPGLPTPLLIRLPPPSAIRDRRVLSQLQIHGWIA